MVQIKVSERFASVYRPWISGHVSVTVDLHYAIDRVSWQLKTSRCGQAPHLDVSDCLLATPSELRQCELHLAAVFRIVSACFDF